MRRAERTDEGSPLLELELTAEDLMADLDPGWLAFAASLESQDAAR
ncbi:MAG: hypothetical protein ACRDKZ_07825 [Actinomycetota bacterium]